MNNKFQSIDDVLYQVAAEEIGRRKKNPVLPLLVGVAGSALAVWSLTASSMADKGNLSSMLMLTGGLIALAGFIKAGVSITSSVPVYKPTGERIFRRELYYDAVSKFPLCAAVEGADMEKLARIPRTSSTGGVLLTVYATESGSFTAVQVSEYIPHAFEPVTDTVKFTGEMARAVVALV